MNKRQGRQWRSVGFFKLDSKGKEIQIDILEFQMTLRMHAEGQYTGNRVLKVKETLHSETLPDKILKVTAWLIQDNMVQYWQAAR